MEGVIATALFFFILIWAFRVEINTAKAKESLERIEKLLNEDKKGKK